MESRSTKYGLVSLPQGTLDQKPDEKDHERVWPVALSSFIACLSSLFCGLMLSFSSPTLAELAEEPNPNRRIFANETSGSLFASCGTIGAVLGTLMTWPISEALGRKAVLLVAGFPAFVGWLLIVYSAYIINDLSAFVAILLTGRLLTGVAAGISSGAVAVYIGEISSKKRRGFFGNWNQLFVTIGSLLGYTLGIINSSYVQYKYYHSALISAAIVLPFQILMFLPTTAESPRWLYLKGKLLADGGGDYLKTLLYLRGKRASSLISEEIADIKSSAANKMPLKKLLGAFRSFTVLWPSCLVMMLMFFQQFSGVNAIVFFSSEIFEQADFTKTQSNLATLGAVGVVQFAGTLLSVFLIDRLGRKTLLVVSSVGMLLSCVLLGVYFYIYNDICHSCLASNCEGPVVCQSTGIGWLAISSMVLFIAAFSIGWGPVPWTMLSELLSDNIRTLAGSLAALTNWLSGSIITTGFEGYVNAVTPKFAWWTFAVVMLVSVIAVIFVLPETRGLSFSEIQDRFKEKKIIAVSCPNTCRRQM